MAKVASASGRLGESYTLQMRSSPEPLRSLRRVVEAWATMLPPMGLEGSLTKLMAPSTDATTWLVITTAMPNSSARRSKVRKNLMKMVVRVR